MVKDYTMTETILAHLIGQDPWSMRVRVHVETMKGENDPTQISETWKIDETFQKEGFSKS